MINDEIREREVRLIDEKGAQLGVMPTQQALALAEERGMDLVALQVNVRPVVCKLMDYDKYRYEQSRRERESRKNQRIVEVKEVQLSATIAENDVLTKAKAAIRFLENGDKVRVSIRFRGRQITHSEIGLKVMQDFAERCAEVSVIERRPILDGRNMIMILAPKAAKASFAEKKAAREKAATAQQEAQE
ncbi:MAG: translation initiation factor IF-3 [Clostridia bacterium]|nr:translation initiation factor IF-3 [Clostridia bacterium]